MSALPEWLVILIMTLGAGLSIPLGAWLARCENIQPKWLEQELRHFIMAFGGGALLSAVAFVLVPEGSKNLSTSVSCLAFAAGGLAFLGLDYLLAKSKTPASQLAAMLSDFVPEAIALGAAFTKEPNVAILLAGLIAMQNVPEGFNAYREMTASKTMSGGRVLRIFLCLALLGPICGLTGHFFLADAKTFVGVMELFAAGGILYLVIQDIAPQAKLEKHWLPGFGAVLGFLLGLLGHLLTQ
ncbi:MAG: divalent cation transporter [Verrucomicrobiota bacterium JB023]|nr:divalent cation transporter [Verrucomicrobiota bacterium JB023]